ncbi:zeta toxin family protein [Streptomyces lavendulae]|uniref:zeta toxin family protein n=1 Tax=Streptomyces lavendulae TaxID=1914 RepID=UPI0036B37BBC
MIDPDEVERYRLPEAENRRIFHMGIVPELLERRAPQTTPTVVFLIGQPGAGKSRLTEMVAAALNQHGGFVDVDSDLYKPYHPDYDVLMAQDDTLMAAYTRADGRAWMAQAEEYVRVHRLHAIIQETSQNASAVEAKMVAYRQAGARVEALFMGVPKAMSDQGIVNRYFEQLADRGQGRLTVQSNADESYRGILDLADRLDDSAVVKMASIYRRGESKPRYSNTVDGDWSVFPPWRRPSKPSAPGPGRPPRARPSWPPSCDSARRVAAWDRNGPIVWPGSSRRLPPLLTAEAAQRLNPQRPSAAAARSRSTTVRRRLPERSSGPAPRPEAQGPAPHQLPEDPNRSRGRGR